MKFGRTVRKLREEKQISIAQLAKKVGMSPTYLAPIERDVFPPPAESKVVKIAKALDQDADEFLALAGRVASDLNRIIRKRPSPTARLLRAVSELPETEIEKIVKAAEGRRRSLGSRRPAAKKSRI
jgi:transcriptional regulator with XRE-family HTH domain